MIFLRRPLVLVLVLLVGFWAFSELGYRKLANPDEGRYSEIAREMADSGDFVTPRLNGLKYFEKPPLQYWATAVAFKLFGEGEFSARLYTFLCGIGCILLIAYTGSRLFDHEAGAMAALVLLGAPYFMMLSEIVTLDMGLTFWMTLGICGFVLGQADARDQQRRRWMLLAWAGMAGAVLSKGLIGIVFPAAAIFLYCVAQRDFRLLLKLEWLRGLILFLLLAAPWFVIVSIRNPEFAHFFFIHEHFERFLTTSHRREAAWWYFVPIVFVGFLPWMFALLPAVIGAWRTPAISKADGGTFAPLKFALLFSAFVLLFFSKSSSKLPAYILPMFPLLALVIAVYLKKTSAKMLGWLALPVLPLALAGAYAAWVAPAQRGSRDAPVSRGHPGGVHCTAHRQEMAGYHVRFRVCAGHDRTGGTRL
jgi:4-amino-4-deoxy-L-arabinose transferase-like glycosyltransferase